MNTTRPKGNQKHIDLSGRIRIEQGLNNGESFRSIAIALHKDPSTISKEVRRHSVLKESRATGFSPILVPIIMMHLNHDLIFARLFICVVTMIVIVLCYM